MVEKKETAKSTRVAKVDLIQTSQGKKKKMYILDTNVLIHDPKSPFAFVGSHVGIPSIVLEELDAFKKEGTDRGRSAREVIRSLDRLRERGSLGSGVTLEDGTCIQVLFPPEKVQFPFRLNIEDNQILFIAATLQASGYEVVFISKDLNARVKADALSIPSQDYLKEHVTPEEFYKGWRVVSVPAVQLKNEVPEQVLKKIGENDDPLEVNEFVILASNNNPSNYRLFRHLGNQRFKPVHSLAINWPFKEKNIQQLMALDLLFDNSIQFLTLLGPAGTGKTFLALLAGLYKVQVEHSFHKMLISRPVIPLGRDLGYLPGELKDKLHNWMLPIYDNMDFIIHSVVRQQAALEHDQYQADQIVRQKNSKKNADNGKHQHHRRYRDGAIMPLDDLIAHDKVVLEAITYMRGRSIPYQFILIDEAQNLTPHEIKTLVTRVGEGSKIVLCGDPYQIDSPYLDFASNGLVVASERFKNRSIFGTVFLEKSERSELSQLAAELL